MAQLELEQQLRDPDPKVRERAVREIGERGNAAYVPAVAGLVQDRDEKVRVAVVRTLIRLGSEASLSPLCVAVRDGIPEIRYQALDGLVNFYLPGYVDTGFSGFFRSVNQRVEGLFSNVDTTIADADTRLDQVVVETLRRAVIGAPDMNTRIRAARAAGILRASALRPELVEAVFGGHVELTEEILRALRKIADFSAGPRLVFLLSYPQLSIQRQAATTLGLLRTREAIPELRRLLENSPDKEVRKAALEALAFMPTPETAPVFEQYLRDREGHMRASAALALGRLKEANYSGILEQARSRERDAGVLLALAFALTAKGRKEFLEELVAALGSRLRVGEAEAYLIEAVRDPAVREAIYPMLYHRDSSVRTGLCRVLAVSGDRTSISYLEVLLKDRDNNVVAAASRTIRILRAQGN